MERVSIGLDRTPTRKVQSEVSELDLGETFRVRDLDYLDPARANQVLRKMGCISVVETEVERIGNLPVNIYIYRKEWDARGGPPSRAQCLSCRFTRSGSSGCIIYDASSPGGK